MEGRFGYSESHSGCVASWTRHPGTFRKGKKLQRSRFMLTSVNVAMIKGTLRCLVFGFLRKASLMEDLACGTLSGIGKRYLLLIGPLAAKSAKYFMFCWALG